MRKIVAVLLVAALTGLAASFAFQAPAIDNAQASVTPPLMYAGIRG